MILIIVFILTILGIFIYNRRRLHNRYIKKTQYIKVTPDQEVRVVRDSMIEGRVDDYD